jgi:hypothetical protein
MALIIHKFFETFSGTIIQYFTMKERFKFVNAKLVNTYITLLFHSIAANEWFDFQIGSIGTMILCSYALLVLLPKSIIPLEFVGIYL